MSLQPKSKPGSPPPISPSTQSREFKNMTIPELVRFLLSAVKLHDHERVEEALLFRESQLRVQVELQRLAKIHAEQELKKREQLFEALLKDVKKTVNTLEELERENLKLMEEKKKLEDGDGSVIHELREKIAELEKKLEEGENANKKNLETIEELKDEKVKLVYVNFKGEGKFAELLDRVVALREEVKLLMSVKENSQAESAVPSVVAVKEEVDVGGSAPPLERSKDITHRKSLGASLAEVESGLADVIEIEDGDGDGDENDERGTQPQTVETLKRKISYSDSKHSSNKRSK